MAASGQRAAYVAPSPQDKLLNPGSYSINIHGEKGRASKKRKYVRYYSTIMEQMRTFFGMVSGVLWKKKVLKAGHLKLRTKPY